MISKCSSVCNRRKNAIICLMQERFASATCFSVTGVADAIRPYIEARLCE
jgi:hypothetical protein